MMTLPYEHTVVLSSPSALQATEAKGTANEMLQKLAYLLDKVAKYKTVWAIRLPEDEQKRTLEEGKRFCTTIPDEYSFGK